MRMAVSRFRSCERSFWQATTMPVGRGGMRTAESAGVTPRPPRPGDPDTSPRISPSLATTSTASPAGARMDGPDRVLPVLRARQGDLQLEGFQRRARPLQALLDLRGHALVAGLGGHLPQEARLFGLADEVLEGPQRPRQLGPLLHQP